MTVSPLESPAVISLALPLRDRTSLSESRCPGQASPSLLNPILFVLTRVKLD